MRAYFAELLGTFVLTFAVLISLGSGSALTTAVLAALTLGLLVYTIGPISHSHVNPAVTIGMWTVKKIKSKDAVGYLIAQFIGAAIAIFVAGSFVTLPTLVVSNDVLVGAAELIGAFFFVFGVSAVAFGKVSHELSGVVIGGSLLLGIVLASVAGNGLINPAVALGANSFNAVYILGPIFGGILGAWVFKFLYQKN